MRITIEIDEKLINDAMELTGVWTQRAAIEVALKELLKNPPAKPQMLSMIGSSAAVGAPLEKVRKANV